jgi:hypothetical protein
MNPRLRVDIPGLKQTQGSSKVGGMKPEFIGEAKKINDWKVRYKGGFISDVDVRCPLRRTIDSHFD